MHLGTSLVVPGLHLVVQADGGSACAALASFCGAEAGAGSQRADDVVSPRLPVPRQAGGCDGLLLGEGSGDGSFVVPCAVVVRARDGGGPAWMTGVLALAAAAAMLRGKGRLQAADAPRLGGRARSISCGFLERERRAASGSS